MIKQVYLAVGVLLVVAVVLAGIPVIIKAIENGPKADPSYVRRVWADHTVGQTFAYDHPLVELEILVRGQRDEKTALEVTDGDGNVVAKKNLELTSRDEWVPLWFAKPLSPGAQQVTLRAPNIQEQADAILVRFQIDSDIYDGGHMTIDGQESYGDIAFRAYERGPLWRAVQVAGQITNTSAQKAFGALAGGAIIAALLFASSRLLRGRWTIVLPFVLLVLLSIAIRVPYTYSIEGVFGGDAFNYLSKTSALLAGEDPFAADPRKGPLFSLLLVPGFFQRDPLLWSRWVGIAAAAAAVVITPLVARRFGISWQLALLSGLLLAVNKEFIWESPNGLANTLYTALIIASVWAYVELLRSPRPRWLWLLAALLGLTALTRYEGILVAAVLLPAVWMRQRIPLKQVAKSVAITGALIAIPFTSYIWSGVSGIRTLPDIRSDGGLSLVDSAGQLEANLSRAQAFFAGLWLNFESLPPVMPPLLFGMIAAAALAAFGQSYPAQRSYTATVLAIAVLVAMTVLMMMKASLGPHDLIALTLLATGAGIVWMIYAGKSGALAMLIVALLQVAIITLMLPKSRYFLPAIPFVSLALAASLQALTGKNPSRLRHALGLLIGGTAATYFFLTGSSALAVRAEKYNSNAQDTAVLVNALYYLRNSHGNVGSFATGEVPVRIYIPPQRLFLFSDSSNTGTAGEIAWISEHHIKYLLERDRQPYWQSVRAHPDAFVRVHTFDSIFGDSKVFVYQVK